MNKKHDFGEKLKEYANGEELPVWQSPKFKESKEKAIELIDSGNYGLVDGDFWILMNKTKNGKMAYTGLIISHDGCLKINDKLPKEKRYKPECLIEDKEGYGGALVIKYICPEQGLYEYGEVSKANCKNAYPYAMALKRCLDRVILKNSGVALYGIYSETESDEFRNVPSAPEKYKRKQWGAEWKKLLELHGIDMTLKENWFKNLPVELQEKASEKGYKAFTDDDWKRAYEFVKKEEAEALEEAALDEEANY